MFNTKALLMCGAAVVALGMPAGAQQSSNEGAADFIVITPGSDEGGQTAQTEGQTDGTDAATGDEPVTAQSDGTLQREGDAAPEVATGQDAAPETGVDGAVTTAGDSETAAPGGDDANAAASQMTAESGATAPGETGASVDTTTAQTAAPETPDIPEASPDDGAQGAAMASDAPVDEETPEAMADAPDAGMTPLEGTGSLNDDVRDSDMAEEGGETELNPDLEELARQADGRLLGATDGAAQMDRGMSTQQAMSVLDDIGEAFYERGYRQGYLRGIQDARDQMQQTMLRDRLRRSQEQASRQPVQQRPEEQQRMREMARQQAAQGGGLPQIIVVPQGTDLQALMQQLRAMQQGG